MSTQHDEPGQRPVTWPLISFTPDREKFLHKAVLYLDRANSDFGFVQYTASKLATAVTYADTGEPVYFSAKHARAAAWRDKCRKVCVLFAHFQVDLEFKNYDQARGFLNVLRDLATANGNHVFFTYDVPNCKAFMSSDFDMIRAKCVAKSIQPWMVVPIESSDWPRLRKTGDWTDFTIIAEGIKIPVHRIKICKESFYFKALCSGRFSESVRQSVQLPESAATVNNLLDEMYTSYSLATASLFTNFATRAELEKEHVLSQLLALFIAADKYILEKTKRKAIDAIIDRLPFISNPLVVVGFASSVHHESCPSNDRGLRKTALARIQACMPSILADEKAWEDFSANKVLLKEFHAWQCEKADGDKAGEVGVSTPSATPRKKRAHE